MLGTQRALNALILWAGVRTEDTAESDVYLCPTFDLSSKITILIAGTYPILTSAKGYAGRLVSISSFHPHTTHEPGDPYVTL